MRAESNSEANYHGLIARLGDLAESYAYSNKEFDIGLDVRLTVFGRDECFRPQRITLSRPKEPGYNDTPSFIEVHLYHDFEIAIALACLDTQGYRSVYDDNGLLNPSSLAEFNELLDQWVQRIARHSERPASRRPSYAPEFSVFRAASQP